MEAERHIFEKKQLESIANAESRAVEREKIKDDVFKDAEKKKAGISSGATGRDRFNNINNSLRQ